MEVDFLLCAGQGRESGQFSQVDVNGIDRSDTVLSLIPQVGKLCVLIMYSFCGF